MNENGSTSVEGFVRDNGHVPDLGGYEYSHQAQ
jgi:hypothetical protein